MLHVKEQKCVRERVRQSLIQMKKGGPNSIESSEKVLSLLTPAEQATLKRGVMLDEILTARRG